MLVFWVIVVDFIVSPVSSYRGKCSCSVDILFNFIRLQYLLHTETFTVCNLRYDPYSIHSEMIYRKSKYKDQFHNEQQESRLSAFQTSMWWTEKLTTSSPIFSFDQQRFQFQLKQEWQLLTYVIGILCRITLPHSLCTIKNAAITGNAISFSR